MADENSTSGDRKADALFEYARKAAETGNYDYAIDLFLQALAIVPNTVAQHQELRDIAMKRTASGGKSLGMMDRMKSMKQSNAGGTTRCCVEPP